ncbi:MAG: hypothetical protein JW818_00360 [Pirellulales bacterium]|nr:hypothetical protein [Pirellulales bacterium]
MPDPSPRRAPSRLSRWLESAPEPVFVTVAITAAFSAYFCTYAFRKPFSAVPYKGLTLWGIDLKAVLVIGQLIGYTLAKYAGIKLCSEVTRRYRAAVLIGVILLAEAALVLFAVVPVEWKVAAIFLNGIPLGIVWGVIFLYLEGRRFSEVLLAGLTCSYIVASGVVKDVGNALMTHAGVSLWWMPAAAGALFLPVFLVSVWLLDQLPEPTPADEAARTHRQPMHGSERLAFFRCFRWGLLLQLVLYFFVTAMRDLRDNYGAEVFESLGYGPEKPTRFTTSETFVALGVVGAMAALNLFRDNRRGFQAVLGMMAVGTVLVGAATLLLDAGLISGMVWMILLGLGCFLMYVPNGSIFFDRLLASTRYVGTAVFAVYLIDGVGYTGSVTLNLYKALATPDVDWLDFLRVFSYLLALLGLVILAFNSIYFTRKARSSTEPPRT